MSASSPSSSPLVPPPYSPPPRNIFSDNNHINNHRVDNNNNNNNRRNQYSDNHSRDPYSNNGSNEAVRGQGQPIMADSTPRASMRRDATSPRMTGDNANNSDNSENRRRAMVVEDDRARNRMALEEVETAPNQGGMMAVPIKTRLGDLERHLGAGKGGSSSSSPTILERIAALEVALLGTATVPVEEALTIQERLVMLEEQTMDATRTMSSLEQDMQMGAPNYEAYMKGGNNRYNQQQQQQQEESLFSRLAVLEMEILGQASTGPLSSRLSELTKHAADWSRIVRLERELAMDVVVQQPNHQKKMALSRLDRVGALEVEVFGAMHLGTTFSSRLSRLEAELLG